jgi:hypothetical protein
MDARRAWLALLPVALVALPALALRAQPPRTDATYSARVEVRSGMCCSQSCGAISTLSDLTLTLAADGTATLHWVRAGCLVTISSSGGGPMHMPIDPGPPASVCAMGGPGAELRALAGDVTQHGSWTHDGPGSLVTLDPSTTLRCAPARVDGRALLACTMEAPGIDATGLTLAGQLYLDAAPGLSERLDASERVVLARSPP